MPPQLCSGYLPLIGNDWSVNALILIKTTMNVDNFRLQIGGKEYVPIIIGGMGVNISTTELALAAEKLGGIGHISDALIGYVCDRIFKTSFVSRKRK